MYKKAVNAEAVAEAEEKSEGSSFESEPSEDLKASRKEGLELVKSVINVEDLKVEETIQTPKKNSTKKAATKKGGKKGAFVGRVSFQGFLKKIKRKCIQSFPLVPLRQNKVESGAFFFI